MMRRPALLICILILPCFSLADGIPISIGGEPSPPIITPDPDPDPPEFCRDHFVAPLVGVYSHADAADLAVLAGNDLCELREAVESWRTQSPVDDCPAGTPNMSIDLRNQEPITLVAPLDLTLPEGVQSSRELWICGNERARGIVGSAGHFIVGSDVELRLRGLDLIGGSRDKGGSIFSEGALVVHDVSFVGNSASEGGAIYSTGHLSLSKTSFFDNSATAHGGAVFAADGLSPFDEGLFRTVVFSRNSAGGTGGAIYLESLPQSSFVNLVFRENSAADGAAIVAQNSYLRMMNIFAHDNVAENQEGTQLRFEGGEVELNQSTITNNTGTGVASASMSTLIVRNSVFSDNSAGDCDFASGTWRLDVGYASDASCNGTALGAAPLLALADHGGNVLSRPPVAGSILVDASQGDFPDYADVDDDWNVWEDVPYDLRGANFLRVASAAADLGAFEAGQDGNAAPFSAEEEMNLPWSLHLRDPEPNDFLLRISSSLGDNYGLDVSSIDPGAYVEVFIEGIPTGDKLPVSWELPEHNDPSDLRPPDELYFFVEITAWPEEFFAYSAHETVRVDLVLPPNVIYDFGLPPLGNEQVVRTLILEPVPKADGGGGGSIPATYLLLFLTLLRHRQARAPSGD